MKIKNKNKKNMEKKILIVEGVIVIGILIYLFLSNSPSQVSPLSGQTIIDPDFTFEIENGEEVVLSIDPEFSVPIILKEGSDVVLPPGVYYWKVKGLLRESEVRTFTIQSHVGLNLNEMIDSYEIENAGNVDLDLVKEGGSESFDLGVGESIDVEKDDSKYEGKQK